MTQIFADGFDHYGGVVANIFEGAWTTYTGTPDDDFSLTTPASGARTGSLSLKVGGGTSNDAAVSRVLGSSNRIFFCGLGLFITALPTAVEGYWPFKFSTKSGADILTITLTPDGSIEVRSGDRTGLVLGTSSPVVVAGSWQHLELGVTVAAALSTVAIRLNGTEILALTGVTLVDNPISTISTGTHQPNIGASNAMYIDDMVFRNNKGAYNNGFMGQLKVATINCAKNASIQDWAAFIAGVSVNVGDAYKTLTSQPLVDADYIRGSAAPALSEFGIGPPPSDVVDVFSGAIATRVSKSNCAVSDFSTAFRSLNGSQNVGSRKYATTAPKYFIDNFDTDQVTGFRITPSTVVGGNIELRRDT